MAKVRDAVTNNASEKLGDFQDGTNTDDDYAYDANGNLTQDKNKGITSITYNYLNLPSVITVANKGTITYTYDASGNKWQKVTVDNMVSPARTTTTLYLGAGQYRNDTLQFFGMSEGRIRTKDSTGLILDYFLKDHLGNTRLVVTDQPGVLSPVLEETHYYPFGLSMAGISYTQSNPMLTNKYRYNSIEQNNDFDLNMYDAFYRNLDPQIGRFWQLDPKPHEAVSLYASMGSNPINFSDLLGDTIMFSQAFQASTYGKQIMNLLKNSETFKKMLSAYDIGGEGSFFGGDGGKYADNTNVVFDVINDNDDKGNSASGGGHTDMEVQNSDGQWVNVYNAKVDDLSKDSKTRINILLNPNSKEANSLQKATNIVAHESTAHGAVFLDMSNILHSFSPKDFIQYRNLGNSVYFGSGNNILSNGYYNSNIQHAIISLGLNGFYNAIRQEVNGYLLKQGKSLLPNDVGAYQPEAQRVQAAFKNINQVTQLNIYGPAK